MLQQIRLPAPDIRLRKLPKKPLLLGSPISPINAGTRAHTAPIVKPIKNLATKNSITDFAKRHIMCATNIGAADNKSVFFFPSVPLISAGIIGPMTRPKLAKETINADSRVVIGRDTGFIDVSLLSNLGKIGDVHVKAQPVAKATVLTIKRV